MSNTAAMPDWPRRMKADLAAAYCGISQSKFKDGVKARRYPQAVRDGGNVLWYLEDLDEAMDRQKGDEVGPASSASQEGSEWMEAINGT